MYLYKAAQTYEYFKYYEEALNFYRQIKDHRHQYKNIDEKIAELETLESEPLPEIEPEINPKRKPSPFPPAQESTE